MITGKITNFVSFVKEVQGYNEKRIKAYRNAVKIEMFRLRKVLKKEIEESAPGGQKFAPLSEATKKIWKWQLEELGVKDLRVADHPLIKLAGPIRYKVWINPTNMHMQIGFVGKMSASMFRLVNIHQEGFTAPLTTRMGTATPTLETFFAKGGSGPMVHTPARPIIGPFWSKYQRGAERNIIKNFELKMAGKRI